jgi:DNA-binding CsgD family transcriptional regulator
LFERDAELAAAGVGLRAAAAGAGSLIVIGGVPGAGRSTLLECVAASAAASPVAAERAMLLRADATPPEQDFGFGVVRQLFGPAVLDAPQIRRRRWFRGPAGSVLPMFLDDSRSLDDAARSSAGFGWESVLPGLHALLVNMSEDRVALVAVDDLQWADPQSLRWLGYLAKRLAGTKIMMVGAVSDGCAAAEQAPLLRELVASAARRLTPGPLSVAGVAAMVGEEFGQDCDGAFALACHGASGGNPASLTAVIRGLHAKGVRPVAACAGDVEAESQALLCGRRMFWLSTQPRPVRDVATGLAVLRELAEPGLLGDLVGLDELACADAVAALDRLGLLAAADAPRLVHPSVGLAVETAMTVDERERMHRRAAALLRDAGHPAERVADQLLLVAPRHERWETDVLRSAAGAALERGAGKAAARYLRRALLNSPPDGETRGRLLVDLAAAERDVDLAASVRHVSQALLVLESAPERAAAALWIPPALAAADPSLAELVRSAAGRLADAEAEAGGADAGAAGAHRELALRLEARTRYIGLQDGVELKAALRRLAELGTGAPASTGAERELLAVLAFAASVAGGLRAGDVVSVAGRILEREPADARHAYTALPVLVPALIAADAPGALEPWLDAAGEDARRRGSAGVSALVDAERGAVLCAQGRLAKARTLAAGVFASVGQAWPEAASAAAWTLTSVALQTQDVELAERVLLHDEAAGGLHAAVTRRMLSAMVDAVRGDTAAALERFLDCGRRLARSGWTNPALYPWRQWAAAACQRLGDLDGATALADEECEAAQAWGAPAAHGRALRLRGVLTGGAQGVDLLREAVDRLRRSQDRVELSRAATILGGRLLETGSSQARDFLAEGKRVARECGVSWVGGNEGAEFNGPVLRLEPTGLAELTKSEAAIVALVVRGWTNQQVADSLGVTRRAVEKNLTGAYRKLGVGGRAALIDELGAAIAGETSDTSDASDADEAGLGATASG